MLNHARLPNVFWADAISTATYLRNRMITSSLKSGKTPYQMWYGEKPNLEHVRIFGCAHVPDVQRKKLDKKARKLRLIGYTNTAENYRVWDEEKQRCYVRHDVIFNESDCGTATESPKQATVEPTTDVPLTLSSQKDPLTQEE